MSKKTKVYGLLALIVVLLCVGGFITVKVTKDVKAGVDYTDILPSLVADSKRVWSYGESPSDFGFIDARAPLSDKNEDIEDILTVPRTTNTVRVMTEVEYHGKKCRVFSEYSRLNGLASVPREIPSDGDLTIYSFSTSPNCWPEFKDQVAVSKEVVGRKGDGKTTNVTLEPIATFTPLIFDRGWEKSPSNLPEIPVYSYTK